MSRYNLLFGLVMLVLIFAPVTHASDGQADSVPQLPSASIVPDPNGTEVFIHIRSEKQQPAADRIKKSLEDEGYAVPRIILVAFGPNENQVRYFHRDRNQAAEVVHDMSGLHLGPIEVRSIAHYEKTMPPKRYEVWLAPDTQ